VEGHACLWPSSDELMVEGKKPFENTLRLVQKTSGPERVLASTNHLVLVNLPLSAIRSARLLKRG
jgi:hypothetical protein